LDNVFLSSDKNYKIFNFGNASNKIFEKITERVKRIKLFNKFIVNIT